MNAASHVFVRFRNGEGSWRYLCPSSFREVTVTPSGSVIFNPFTGPKVALNQEESAQVIPQLESFCPVMPAPQKQRLRDA